MTAQASVDDSFTFVGGLNTEGGYFVTPKNCWKEGDNIVPKKDGSVERRPAIGVEENGVPIKTLTTKQAAGYAYTVNVWESVGGNGNRDWFVVQMGARIHLYDGYPGTISARPIAGSYNGASFSAIEFGLTAFKCYGNEGLIYDKPISVASVYGNLIITHEDCEPFVVIWQEGNVLTTNTLKLKIRDFKGIPSPKSDALEYEKEQWETFNFWPHAKYNLYNQGWSDSQLDVYVSSRGGRYPANTKQWIYGKDSNDNFDVSVLDKVDFGTAPAPKGRFILEAFYEDRAAALDQVTDVNSDNGISSEVGKPGEYDPVQELP